MEHIPAVIHAMFWMGAGITLKVCGDWLKAQIKDDELLPSWKSTNEALGATKDRNGK